MNGRLMEPEMALILRDYLDDVGRLIEAETDHEGVRVGYLLNPTVGTCIIRTRCDGCGSKWTTSLGTPWDAGRQPIANWFCDVVLPSFKAIAAQDCWSMLDRRLLAEWLTEELETAGRLGMTYQQLADRAQKGRLVPSAVLDKELRRLKFMADEPIDMGPELEHFPRLVLPEGHPRRTW